MIKTIAKKIREFTESYPRFFQFVRFCMVGVMNTLVYYAVYLITIRLGFHYTLAVTCGTAVGIINSYIWNKLFVFKAREKVSAGEVIKFITVYGVQYAVNQAIVHIGIAYIGIPAELAAIPAVCVSPLVSFFGLKYWGFRKKKTDTE